MANNFRGKYIKDTETPPESILDNTCFTNNLAINRRNTAASISSQQLDDNNFDNFLEKKK